MSPVRQTGFPPKEKDQSHMPSAAKAGMHWLISMAGLKSRPFKMKI